MADDWTTTYCINEDGFPRVLYAATVRLGIPERPEYVGREFMKHGTESCEVTIHIGASDKYLEMQPWSITATGARMPDTIQLAARKALRYLCQMFEWHLGSTPMNPTVQSGRVPIKPPELHSKPKAYIQLTRR